jgi:hypothetical protein
LFERLVTESVAGLCDLIVVEVVPQVAKRGDEPPRVAFAQRDEVVPTDPAERAGPEEEGRPAEAAVADLPRRLFTQGLYGLPGVTVARFDVREEPQRGPFLGLAVALAAQIEGMSPFPTAPRPRRQV